MIKLGISSFCRSTSSEAFVFDHVTSFRSASSSRPWSPACIVPIAKLHHGGFWTLGNSCPASLARVPRLSPPPPSPSLAFFSSFLFVQTYTSKSYYILCVSSPSCFRLLVLVLCSRRSVRMRRRRSACEAAESAARTKRGYGSVHTAAVALSEFYNVRV